MAEAAYMPRAPALFGAPHLLGFPVPAIYYILRLIDFIRTRERSPSRIVDNGRVTQA